MMMLVAMPTKAFAASPPDVTAGDVCAIVNNGGDDEGYASLADAWAAASDGDAIYLLANINEPATLIDLDDFLLTIDLNGFNLDIKCIDLVSDSSLTITNSKPATGGDITLFDYLGVDGSYLKIDARSVSINPGNGIQAVNSAEVLITADINSAGKGILANGEDVKVTIHGNITAVDECIAAENGATVTVYGNLKGDFGIDARSEGTVVKVYGNIDADEDGIDAFQEAYVYLKGNITAVWIGVSVVAEALVEVEGDIKVTGDDTADDRDEFPAGVLAALYGEALIKGNITVLGDDGVGVACALGGLVTLDGKIVAETYILFMDVVFEDDLQEWVFIEKTAADNDATSQKPDYLQYSQEFAGEYPDLGIFAGTSYVWVKDFTPPTGDSMGMIVMMTALSLLALGALCLLVWRKRQQVTAY